MILYFLESLSFFIVLRWNPKIQCERYFIIITKSRNTNEETALEDTQFVLEVIKYMTDALKVK